MSLDGFYRGLAAMVADPRLVRRSRQGDNQWLDAFELTNLERARLCTMAGDGRIEVMCSLYRSNRLTALVRTVPALVDALGERLEATVTEFWVSFSRPDLQWRTEAIAFCDFVDERYRDETDLRATAAAARNAVVSYYDESSASVASEP